MGRFSGKRCRLVSMFWLTTVFFFVEILVGYMTNSMALIADSFHMLSDVAALVVAFLSVKVSTNSLSGITTSDLNAKLMQPERQIRSHNGRPVETRECLFYCRNCQYSFSQTPFLFAVENDVLVTPRIRRRCEIPVSCERQI